MLFTYSFRVNVVSLLKARVCSNRLISYLIPLHHVRIISDPTIPPLFSETVLKINYWNRPSLWSRRRVLVIRGSGRWGRGLNGGGLSAGHHHHPVQVGQPDNIDVSSAWWPIDMIDLFTEWNIPAMFKWNIQYKVSLTLSTTFAPLLRGKAMFTFSLPTPIIVMRSRSFPSSPPSFHLLTPPPPWRIMPSIFPLIKWQTILLALFSKIDFSLICYTISLIIALDLNKIVALEYSRFVILDFRTIICHKNRQ